MRVRTRRQLARSDKSKSIFLSHLGSATLSHIPIRLRFPRHWLGYMYLTVFTRSTYEAREPMLQELSMVEQR